MHEDLRRFSAIVGRLAKDTHYTKVGQFIRTVLLLAILAIASGFTSEKTAKTIEDFAIHPLSGQAVEKLIVKNPIGPVEITYSEQSPPEVRIQKTGRGAGAALTQKSLDSVKVDISEKDGLLRITTHPPRVPGWWFSASVRVKVVLPASSIQNISLAVSRGEIAINGIRIRDFAAATTGNGGIEVQNVAGKLDLSTSDGKIVLGNVDLRPGSRLVTSNGAIRGRLRIWAPGSYYFEATSGYIDLTMSDLASVTIEASAPGGNFQIKDLPGLIVDEIRPNYLRGHTGDGEVRLNLVSKDGDIAISRGDK
ncbi:MAG: hypothetical protein ACM3TT_08115 [Syntrophothermus sp.]